MCISSFIHYIRVHFESRDRNDKIIFYVEEKEDETDHKNAPRVTVWRKNDICTIYYAQFYRSESLFFNIKRFNLTKMKLLM